MAEIAENGKWMHADMGIRNYTHSIMWHQNLVDIKLSLVIFWNTWPFQDILLHKDKIDEKLNNNFRLHQTPSSQTFTFGIVIHCLHYTLYDFNRTMDFPHD